MRSVSDSLRKQWPITQWNAEVEFLCDADASETGYGETSVDAPRPKLPAVVAHQKKLGNLSNFMLTH